MLPYLDGLKDVNSYSPDIRSYGTLYNFMVGIEGASPSRLSYNVFAAVRWYDRYFPWSRYVDGDTAGFDIYWNDVMAAAFGANIDVCVARNFTIRLAGEYIGEMPGKHEDPMAYIPKYTASLYMDYRKQGIFSVSLGAELIGPRNFYTYIKSSPERWPTYRTVTSPVVDIRVSGEYFVSRGFAVFAEGRNLAGMKLYPFNHYRGYGAEAMVGVKMVF
jgi:hypothetical protein